MSSGEEQFGPLPGKGAEFVTTHWSVVVGAARRDSPEALAALDKLCRTNVRPCPFFCCHSSRRTLRHRFSTRRHKSNFNAFVHRGGNPLQHRERVTFVVSVFEAGDHRLGRSHSFGQLFLCQLRFATE